MSLWRVSAAGVLLASSLAPYQCAREPDPNRRIEDEPSEAVHMLADRFKEAGDAEARATTLRYLIERYPTSRFANMARIELQEMGQPAPPAPPED